MLLFLCVCLDYRRFHRSQSQIGTAHSSIEETPGKLSHSNNIQLANCVFLEKGAISRRSTAVNLPLLHHIFIIYHAAPPLASTVTDCASSIMGGSIAVAPGSSVRQSCMAKVLARESGLGDRSRERGGTKLPICFSASPPLLLYSFLPSFSALPSLHTRPPDLLQFPLKKRYPRRPPSSSCDLPCAAVAVAFPVISTPSDTHSAFPLFRTTNAETRPPAPAPAGRGVSHALKPPPPSPTPPPPPPPPQMGLKSTRRAICRG